ncbi:uncharacterized protein LOC122304535 [Carya illinoinensis]|uniref:uncharacterized protein LOC122304535 n=1 Tax=Carya illinoinensis TaxID=32201 RepID=UPI001C71A927|nr:uncharacterized protein LOC122304535 [Carya illinoinensis]
MIGPILYWNVRGLGTSRGRLKKLVKEFKPKVFALAETFVDDSKMGRLMRQLGLEEGSSNQLNAGKIWLLWEKNVNVTIVRMSDQFITVKVLEGDLALSITFVYAKCYYGLRRQLWRDLQEDVHSNDPWMILGDFNVIKNNEEWKGGSPCSRIALEEFNEWINGCGLMDLNYNGNNLSWCNGQEGLERRREGGLENLAFKMKRMKQVLRRWNKEIFGHVKLKIKELEWRVESLEAILQGDYEAEVEQDLLVSKIEIDIWQKREECLTAQRAGIKWLQEGDNNTRFFHAVLKRRQQNQVTKMNKPDGTAFNTPEAIHEGAVQYFQEFLSHKAEGEPPYLSSFIDQAITEDENKNIYKRPSMEEIWQAINSIPVESSPGPDGFGSGFFKACWAIGKGNVEEAIAEFFEGKQLPRYYTASYVALIPKVQ